MIFTPPFRSLLPPIYKTPIPPSFASTAFNRTYVPITFPFVHPPLHPKPAGARKATRLLRVKVKRLAKLKITPVKKKNLHDHKIGELTNAMINTSQPLSAKQAKLVTMILENHFDGTLPLGYSKIRKKEPLYKKFNLPCSLFVKADPLGRITNIYLSINEALQEGHDKKVEQIFDITGSENKVLLKAKRTLSQNGIKYQNPAFEICKRNMKSELDIQENLASKPGIASVSKDDKVSWRRDYSDEGQAGYIMDKYLGDMLDHLTVASKRKASSAIQLLRGLKSIHEEGIVHGDLKLENILVRKYGNLGISDFGRSSLQEPGRKLKMRPGTFQYSSPEMLLNLPLDGRKSDIFSMGYTLYCLLFKEEPQWSEDARKAGTILWKQNNPVKGRFHLNRMLRELKGFRQYDVQTAIEYIREEERQALEPLLEKRRNGEKSIGDKKAIDQIRKKSRNEQKELRMIQLIQEMVNPTPELRPDALTALEVMRAINSSRPHSWV